MNEDSAAVTEQVKTRTAAGEEHQGKSWNCRETLTVYRLRDG